MIACMSRDPYVMGLCGETKIANKADSWVTAIQGKFETKLKFKLINSL